MDNGIKPIQRPPSVLDGLLNGHKLDVRAHQRTYEGAYTRTAIGALSFAILILKLFSKEFLPVGTVYSIYGSILFFIGVVNMGSLDVYYNPEKDMQMYKTGGNTVILLLAISLTCYIVLFILMCRM